ncbi:MAG: hypothetical protein H7Z10_15725, partial [Gemmatimonadaceae bacterium]|nr:hypothetical protein [Acetobacteraceae bacterium]
IARRQGMRAAFGAGAAVFAIGVLVLLHVVAFQAMVPNVGPLAASAILLGVNLVIAGVLAYLAMSNKPDAIEDEAKMIREQAIVEMRKAVGFMALAGEVTGMVLRRPARGVTVVKPRGTVRLAGELAARMMARR